MLEIIRNYLSLRLNHIICVYTELNELTGPWQSSVTKRVWFELLKLVTVNYGLLTVQVRCSQHILFFLRLDASLHRCQLTWDHKIGYRTHKVPLGPTAINDGSPFLDIKRLFNKLRQSNSWEHISGWITAQFIDRVPNHAINRPFQVAHKNFDSLYTSMHLWVRWGTSGFHKCGKFLD
jgi:hypothetical protein